MYLPRAVYVGVIRKPRPDDAADLARVHVVSWQEAYRGLLSQSFLDSIDVTARTEWWERTISTGESSISVGEVDGVVEGFCLSGVSHDPGWGEIYAIYTTPAMWGTGLGRALLTAGEASMVDRGFQGALLWVLDGNARASRFYERQGWSLAAPFRIETIGGTEVTERRYEKRLEGP
ncbi:MAG: GNAT family N-acetyltransferase [Acidimicrobiia bacterium]